MSDKPQTRAFLICDLAFQQAGTNAWHIIGIFDQIMVRELPATHSPFVVFWSLAPFHGDALVMTTIRDNVGDVVYALRAMIPKLPVSTFEFAFAFPPVKFAKAGSHTLELQVADELLAVRSFRVHLVEPSIAPS